MNARYRPLESPLLLPTRAADTQVLVGRAGVEAEVLDAVTNERLGAALDRRAGTKALRGGVSTWADVQNAFDYWSERLRTRLAELRRQPTCA
jgi:hypothetical protein